jgi:tetratricopeptide (TPR) repeat protein
LLVTAGPRKGAEIALAGSAVTLGRAEANAVVLPDIAVSREHLRLERKGTAWGLVDSGSGNGTQVNGRAVRRQRLRHGDEIVLGDSTLRYLEAGGVIVQEAARPGSGAGVAGLGPLGLRSCLYAAAAVALAMIFAAGSVRRQRLRAEAEAEAQQKAARAIAAQRIENAISLLGKGRPAEARDQLTVALELAGPSAELARLLESADAQIAGAHAVSPAPVRRGPATAPAPPAVREPASQRHRPPRREPARLRRAGAGRLHQEVRQALAARHVLAATAMDADDDLPRAAAHLRSAIENDPGNAEAHRALDRLAERAKALYLQAYVDKEDDPESAQRNLRLVIAALPSEDEVARKARQWMARLESAEGP